MLKLNPSAATLVLALATCLLAEPAAAQDWPEYRLKAAFIYNFIRYGLPSLEMVVGADAVDGPTFDDAALRASAQRQHTPTSLRR